MRNVKVLHRLGAGSATADEVKAAGLARGINMTVEDVDATTAGLGYDKLNMTGVESILVSSCDGGSDCTNLGDWLQK